MKLTTFGNLNENPLVRTARYLVLAAAAGAVLAIAQALPGVDIPGNYDAAILATAIPMLAGLEKRIRDLNARAKGESPRAVEPPTSGPTPLRGEGGDTNILVVVLVVLIFLIVAGVITIR